MELPYGLTLDEVKGIINEWDKLYDEVKNGTQTLDEYDSDGCANFDDWHEDDEYIDRYLQIGDAEYCITTSLWNDGKPCAEHYLSENIIISTDKTPEHWWIDELRLLVG